MLEYSKKWNELFLGRKDELEWLVGGWDEVIESGSPQIRVIISDSGYGKTRLAQRFYTEVSSRRYDRDSYWPDVMTNSENNLRVMPDCSKCSPGIEAKVPWFWYGLRWPDDSDVRNSTLTESPFLKVYTSKEFTVHEEAVLRKHNKKIRGRKRLFKGIKVVTKVGATLGGIGSLGEAVAWGVDKVSRISDGVGIIKDANDFHNTRGGGDSHAELYNKKRAEEVARVVETFRTLLSEDKGEAEALPVILFLDNAHTMDLFSLECLEKIWTLAEENSLPLLVLATHWEREWETHRAEGLDTSALSPAFAKFCLKVERDDSERVFEWRLRGLEENKELLTTAFPCFLERDIEDILYKTAGNPRHMGEVIRALEGMEGDQSELEPYFDQCGAFTDEGREKFAGISHSLEDLERARFEGIERELKDLLGLGSMQGMEYLTEFVVSVARKIDKFAENKESKELIDRAVTPYAVAERIRDSMHGFPFDKYA